MQDILEFFYQFPTISTIGISILMVAWGFFAAVFWYGLGIDEDEEKEVIEGTINFLINEGFLKYKTVDGVIELLKLDPKDWGDKEDFKEQNEE